MAMSRETIRGAKVGQLLTDEFNDFFERIQLKTKQQERIESAVTALSEYLIKHYELDPADVFVQGSFSTDTVVRPAPSLEDEAEYDVDIVIFCADTDATPDDALNDLETTLAENGNYKDKIEKDDPKIPCIRLRYADEGDARFHVDLVPAKRNSDNTIEVPRRGDDWETSDPIKYTTWVLDRGERYRKTLMMLKRWRDESKAPIKSIVLQVMISECLSDSDDDSINVAETLANTVTFLEASDTPPQLLNPAYADEDLTARWKVEDLAKFKEILSEAADVAADAIAEDSHDDAAALWQKVFGEEFIFTTDTQVSIGQSEAALGDTSHAQPLRLPFRPLAGVGVAIDAYFYTPWIRNVYRRNRGYVPTEIMQRRSRIQSGRHIVKSGGNLDYYARVGGLKGKQYEIHWQVVNTGQEATRKDGLRGTFFSSKDTNNLHYNYEQTSYEGTHWIECFVILDNTCVARSGRFYINIEH